MQITRSDKLLNKQPFGGLRWLVSVCVLLLPFAMAHAKPSAPAVSATWPDYGAMEINWGWTRGTETCRVDGYEIQYKHHTLDSTNWPSSTDTNTRNRGKFSITKSLGSTGNISESFYLSSSSDGTNAGEDGITLHEASYDIRVRISDTSATGGCEASDFSSVKDGAPVIGPSGLEISPSYLMLVENGDDGTLSVNLSTRPTDDVTVSITYAGGPIEIKTRELTFTPSNWNTAQTVTVKPLTDTDSATEDVTINFGADGAMEFSMDAQKSVDAIVQEDRGPQIVLTPSKGLTIPEGGSGSVDVGLIKKPSGDGIEISYRVEADRPGDVQITSSHGEDVLRYFDKDEADHIFNFDGNGAKTAEEMYWDSPKRLSISAAVDSNSDNETGTLILTVGNDLPGGPSTEHAGKVLHIPITVIDMTDVSDSSLPTIVTSPDSTLNLAEGHQTIVHVQLSKRYTGLHRAVKITATSNSRKVKVKPHPVGFNSNESDHNSIIMQSYGSPVRFLVTAQPDGNDSDDTATLTFQATGTSINGEDHSNLSTAAKTLTVNLQDESIPGVGFRMPTGLAGDITATFSESVSASSSSVTRFTDTTIDSIITLKERSNTGTDIAFDATISGNTITIDPASDLPRGPIFVQVSDQYWTDSGVKGRISNTTFLVSGPVFDLSPPPISPPAPEPPSEPIAPQPGFEKITVSVADVKVAESSGAQLAFMVILNRSVLAADGTVSVDYATSNGTATAGADYTATSGTLTFSTGESVKYINVPVLDDSHNEGDETMKLTLSNAVGMTIVDGEATGTIENMDPFPKAWLGRFARTMAEQHIDVVTMRLDASRNPGGRAYFAGQSMNLLAGDSGSEFVLGPAKDGYHQPLTPEEVRFDDLRIMSLQDALENSSFAWTSASDAAGGSMAVWGQVAHSVFDGREDKLTFDGKVSSAIVGTDYGNGGWLGGAAISTSSAKGTYDGREVESNGDGMGGMIKSKLTSLTTYGSMEISERTLFWGAIGYGQGSLTLTPKKKDGSYADDEKTDLDWNMLAGGLRSTLLESRAGEGQLNLISDVLWTTAKSDKIEGLEAAKASVTRFRLGLESRWLVDTGGGKLLPTLEFGLRHDGGDAESGLGVELGGSLAWNSPISGFTVDVSSRALIAHEDNDFEERGYSFGILFDPSPSSSRGFSLEVRHELGSEASGGLDALFGNSPLSDRGEYGSIAKTWKIDAAWGLPAFGGRFTGIPNAGFNFFEDGRDFYLGWRLSPAGQNPYNFSFGVQAKTRDTERRGTENLINLDMRMRW